jgi:hypothetical protein
MYVCGLLTIYKFVLGGAGPRKFKRIATVPPAPPRRRSELGRPGGAGGGPGLYLIGQEVPRLIHGNVDHLNE